MAWKGSSRFGAVAAFARRSLRGFLASASYAQHRRLCRVFVVCSQRKSGHTAPQSLQPDAVTNLQTGATLHPQSLKRDVATNLQTRKLAAS